MDMSKKQVYVFLLVLVGILMVLDIGNSGAAEGTKASTILLRCASSVSGSGTTPTFLKKAVSEVENRTEGRIKIEVYWGESLLKARDILRGVQRGVCNMGFIGPLWFPSELPLSSANSTLLYIPKASDTGWVARKWWELWDTCKEFRDEYAKYGQAIWYVEAYDPNCLWSNKRVEKCEDIKGMRIRVTGELWGKMFGAIGGNPTIIITPEVYAALEKGTIDAATFPVTTGKRYKYYEVTKNLILTDVFLSYAYYTVSLRDLERMSEKDRETFLQVGRSVSIQLGEALKKNRETDLEDIKKRGLTTIVPFPVEERAKWAEVPQIRNFIKNWIDEQNAAGRKGTEVMRVHLNTFEVPYLMPPGY
jgi:TRAP-type C4-dicarboxylate transport system substrate-binding protein